jgi:hypothetical protein
MKKAEATETMIAMIDKHSSGDMHYQTNHSSQPIDKN